MRLREVGKDGLEVCSERGGGPPGNQFHRVLVNRRVLRLPHNHLEQRSRYVTHSASATSRYDQGVRPDAVKSAVLLREARLRAGLSQAALADRSGVNRVQINRYEAGAIAPSLDTLIELVRACGFDLPLELVPFDADPGERLGALQQLSPERRLHRMLDGLSASGR